LAIRASLAVGLIDVPPIKTGRPMKRLAMSPHGPDRCLRSAGDKHPTGIGPILGQPASDLGPPRSPQHEGAGECPITQTVGCDTLGRNRSPNGVAWRFPDWMAVGFRFREASSPPHSTPTPKQATDQMRSRALFLGSSSLKVPLPGQSGRLGSTCRWSGDSLPPGRTDHSRRR